MTDPTGTLFAFEIEAARAGVRVPDYFRRRSQWAEHEAEQAVAEYRFDGRES